MIQKSEVRKLLLEKRKAISNERRKEASLGAFTNLKEMGRLLSFSPIGSEIDLTLLNTYLKEKGCLYLVPYEIDLLFHVPLEEIDYILVPGVGFDRKNFRIGYGKGFYDRFLATCTNIPTIGIGFKEQLYEGNLPIDPWDIAIDEIRLY